MSLIYAVAISICLWIAIFFGTYAILTGVS